MSKAALYGIETLSRKQQQELGIVNSQPLGSGKTVYDVMNDRLIELIDNGKLRFTQRWDLNAKDADTTGLPKNFVSKKVYGGINFPMTASFGCEWFLTFGQVKKLGGHIKKGSEAIPIAFHTNGYFKTVERIDQNGEKTEEKIFFETDHFFLRYYDVFQQTDIEGIDFPETKARTEKQLKFSIAACEEMVANAADIPPIHFGGNRAYYSSENYIQMPDKDTFISPQEYYCTLFHELIHSTGNPKRLNRIMNGNKRSVEYAFEELVAEIGAAYLCGYTGILFHTVISSAAYIENWQGRLIAGVKEDKTFFFRAAKEAQKAAEFIKGGKLGRLGDVPANQALKLHWIDISEINIDEKRFQNRSKRFSQATYDSIVNKLSWDKFDPIRVWKDENGKIWLISGHSRTAALKHLGEKKVPAFFITASQVEAEDAKYDYNFLSDGEGTIAELRAFRNDVAKKLTVKEMKLKWKTKYNQYLDWQYLNPKENGLFLKFLEVENYENFPSIRTKASWVGQLRNEFPEIGNEHERELFAFVFNIAPKMQKEQLLKLIRDIMMDRRLEGTHESMALGLNKGNKGTTTRRDMESANKMIESINSEISGWKTHRNKAITEAEKVAVDYRVNALNMQLLEIQKDIKQMIKTQTSLLGLRKRKKSN